MVPFGCWSFARLGLGKAFLAAALLGSMACEKQGTAKAGGGKSGRLKLGFIVKQPEEPWFQMEWTFADQAAKQYGFDLMKIGATDGEKVLAAIDNLAASGARGFVICTPDVRLGPAIVARANAHKLKLLSVDDQFVGPDGRFMTDVHYLGISARKIGRADGVGGTAAPIRWSYEDVGTPLDGELCDCHELEGDGFLDLTLKFRTQEVVEALQLGEFAGGDTVELCVTGTLTDGTPFVACDCIWLVPPHGDPGLAP